MAKSILKLSNILARKTQKYCDGWASAYWHSEPFNSRPRASNETYKGLWEQEKKMFYPAVDILEAEAGYAIDKAWMDDLALHTQIVIKNSPLCYQHGRILYSTLCRFIHSQKQKITSFTIFETGTARGFSSVVMARALSDMQASGKIVTFDVLPHAAPIYWNCIDDFECRKSRRQLLSPWRNLTEDRIIWVEGDSRLSLSKMHTERVHFAFLDGAHSYRDVVFEFEIIATRQKRDDIIVFDDYNNQDFPGLVQAVDEGCIKLGYNKKVVEIGRSRNYVIATRQRD